MRQIPLPLRKTSEQNELIITSSNDAVFNRISIIENETQNRILLLGDLHSGKNLLGRYFEQSVGGLYIPNADELEDEALFFAWNKAHDDRCALFMTAVKEPALWDIKLPDLQSRIASMEFMKILPPDDELIVELIQQRLHHNDLAISNKILSYVVKRMTRNYTYLYDFIEKYIAIAQEKNKPITLDDVKQFL